MPFTDLLPFWIGFNAFVLAMLALDLGIVGRRHRAISMREAGLWSAMWVALKLPASAARSVAAPAIRVT